MGLGGRKNVNKVAASRTCGRFWSRGVSAAKQDVKVCGLVGSSEGRECGEGAWRWQRGPRGVLDTRATR